MVVSPDHDVQIQDLSEVKVLTLTQGGISPRPAPATRLFGAPINNQRAFFVKVTCHRRTCPDSFPICHGFHGSIVYNHASTKTFIFVPFAHASLIDTFFWYVRNCFWRCDVSHSTFPLQRHLIGMTAQSSHQTPIHVLVTSPRGAHSARVRVAPEDGHSQRWARRKWCCNGHCDAEQEQPERGEGGGPHLREKKRAAVTKVLRSTKHRFGEVTQVYFKKKG